MSDVKVYNVRKTASNTRATLAKQYPSVELELAPQGDGFIIFAKRGPALAKFVEATLSDKGVKFVDPPSAAGKLAAAQEKIAKVFAEAEKGPSTVELQKASNGAIADASKEADMATREKTGRKMKVVAERKPRKAPTERRARTASPGGQQQYTKDAMIAKGAEARKRLKDGQTPFREGSKRQLTFEALSNGGCTLEQAKKKLSWDNAATVRTSMWEVAAMLDMQLVKDKESEKFSLK